MLKDHYEFFLIVANDTCKRFKSLGLAELRIILPIIRSKSCIFDKCFSIDEKAEVFLRIDTAVFSII